MGISGIILAGGQSIRMGQDKTLMTYNDETLVEHTIKEMKKIADEIIIASNDTNKYNLPGLVEIPDIYPGMGPLGGMHAGLLKARNEYSFVVSCDMPLFSSKLASLLLERRAEYDVVVPEMGANLEPLCAVYSKRCIEAIEKCLQADIKQVFQFYPDVRVLKVSKSELSKIGEAEKLFFNLNTPEDYQVLLHGKKQRRY
ncbi:MAG: molybdenum cofactor guanylyltransferase [Dehalobacterium sp.]